MPATTAPRVLLTSWVNLTSRRMRERILSRKGRRRAGRVYPSGLWRRCSSVVVKLYEQSAEARRSGEVKRHWQPVREAAALPLALFPFSPELICLTLAAFTV